MITNISTLKTMKKALLTTLLLACGLTVQAFAAGASGTGTYKSTVCKCDHVAAPDGVVSFDFKFTVSGPGGCVPARGAITLADAGCGVRLKGKIHRVEFFNAGSAAVPGTAVVYGVVTNGSFKGRPFRLKIYPDIFDFHIVSALCVEDCPSYFTIGNVPGATTFVP